MGNPLISFFTVKHVCPTGATLASVYRWCISTEFYGDGAMWVSVLVLGAAEHPVPLLSGPHVAYLCLSNAANSQINESSPRL